MEVSKENLCSEPAKVGSSAVETRYHTIIRIGSNPSLNSIMFQGIVSGVIIYGMRSKPDFVHFGATTLDVGTDFRDQAFYEADMLRLQVSGMALDFCSIRDRDHRLEWY